MKVIDVRLKCNRLNLNVCFSDTPKWFQKCIQFLIVYCNVYEENLFVYDYFIGIMSGCLKLLSPEELELLEIPNDMDSRSPIKELMYTTDTDVASKDRKFNLSTVYMEGARFNLFTGNQTLEQREQNFKVMDHILPAFFLPVLVFIIISTTCGILYVIYIL